MKRMFLVRGVQGSGKSTFARMIASKFGKRLGNVPDGEERCMIVEADEYFINPDGEYEFNANELPDAHRWCQLRAKEGMLKSIIVIVANTFSRNWEMDPYKKMASEYGYDVNVIECQNNFGSTHNVPEEIVQRTRDRWEANRQQGNL
jgi:predicted kinase